MRFGARRRAWESSRYVLILVVLIGLMIIFKTQDYEASGEYL